MVIIDLSLADLSKGYNGTTVQTISVPSDFIMPDLLTSTGPAIFDPNYGDRAGMFDLFYMDSDKNPVRGGVVTPPEDIIGKKKFDWAAKILAPVLVCLAVLGMILAGFCIRRRRKGRQEQELLNLKAKGLVNAPKMEVNAPAQRAIELLKGIQTRRKNTLSPGDIEFLLGVLTSGEGGFTPDMIRMTGGANIDEESRAFINDMVLGSRRTGSNPYSTTSGQPSAVWPPPGSGVGVMSRGGSESSDRHAMSLHAQHSTSISQPPGTTTASTNPISPPTSTSPGPLRALSHRQSLSDFTQPNTDSASLLPALPSFTSPKPSEREIRKMSVTRPRGENLSFSSEHPPSAGHSAQPSTHQMPYMYASGYLVTSDHRPSHDMTPHPIKGLETLDVQKIRDYLDLWYHSWNFDMFLFNEMTGGHPLYFSALYAFQASGVLAQFQVDLNKFKHWILSPHNIFADFTAEEYEEIRKIIIRLILATDMAKHFEYLSKFRSKLTASTPHSNATTPTILPIINSHSSVPQAPPALSLQHPENRLVVLEMGMKCADLANPSKTFALSSKWTEVIMEEFFRQGDKERAMGLPISQFMDRTATNVGKCQIGFIDFLVAPMYEAWNLFSGGSEKTGRMYAEVLKNRNKWAGLSNSAQLKEQEKREQGGGGASGDDRDRDPSTSVSSPRDSAKPPDRISRSKGNSSRTAPSGFGGLGEMIGGIVGSIPGPSQLFGGGGGGADRAGSASPAFDRKSRSIDTSTSSLSVRQIGGITIRRKKEAGSMSAPERGNKSLERRNKEGEQSGRERSRDRERRHRSERHERGGPSEAEVEEGVGMDERVGHSYHLSARSLQDGGKGLRESGAEMGSKKMSQAASEGLEGGVSGVGSDIFEKGDKGEFCG
ncbi:High affinity cAMP-specific and IBMX-insensitive 3',5'-cyclic phosphodiesterase 9A [Rhizophlyctis rosea]|nr:High affinity cAMP-specific and IBMX-insensitive 3',5'-cyclic phosphodiesterase 9A [Rhizophlyctis rosea]